MYGKKIRMKRIISTESGRTFIVPLDHGLSVGPVVGLVNITETISKIVKSNRVNAIIVHKGIVSSDLVKLLERKEIALVVHLSGATSLSPDPLDKHIVSTLEHAIKLGADAVSVHVNMGAPTEARMLEELGRISEECASWGIPLLAMMYPKGEKVKDEYDEKYISHAARVATELGADIIKINYPGTKEKFKRIIEGVNTPVVIAGGPKQDSLEVLLQMVYDSLMVGAAGVCFGRNVFQSPIPTKIVETIGGLVHDNWNVEKAMEYLGNIRKGEERYVVVNRPFSRV